MHLTSISCMLLLPTAEDFNKANHQIFSDRFVLLGSFYVLHSSWYSLISSREDTYSLNSQVSPAPRLVTLSIPLPAAL